MASREEIVQENVRSQPRIPARIGTLNFSFSDPAINVTTEQRTVEHETIDDQVIVQTLGRKPDRVSIEGVVRDYELDTIDRLTQTGVVELRTDRWSGDVVVKSTDTSFKRAKSSDNSWLYDATLECLEVDELPPQQELVDVFGAQESRVRGTKDFEPAYTEEEINQKLEDEAPFEDEDEREARREELDNKVVSTGRSGGIVDEGDDEDVQSTLEEIN